jgi:hypothetical protein
VLDCTATLPELNAAVMAILRMAGLHPQESGQGEAGPVASAAATGAIPASSSAPYTAPSPPAAATPIA